VEFSVESSEIVELKLYGSASLSLVVAALFFFRCDCYGMAREYDVAQR